MKIRYLLDNRGLSLVEIMVAILIAGMIIGPISSFLVVHMRSFQATDEIIEIQYNSQLALSQISEIAMESTGIYAIQSADGTSVSYHTNEEQVHLLVFMDLSNNYHVFTIDYSSGDHKVFYAETNNPNDFSPANLAANDTLGDEFVRSVQAIKISPGLGNSSETTSFSDADSMVITLEMLDGEASLNVSTQVKFRNK